jgi:hypothetical protein
MEQFKAWIKQHPYLSGGLVLGLIVLIFVYRDYESAAAANAANAAASTTAAGPDDAQVAAEAALGQAQAAVQAQQDQDNAAVQANQTNANAATQQSANELSAVQSTNQAQTAQTTTVANAQLQAAQSQIAGQVSAANEAADAQVDIAGINAGADTQIAGIQAGVSIDQINANLAGLENTNATQLSITNSNNQVPITESNNELTLGLNTNLTNYEELQNNNQTSIVLDQQNNGLALAEAGLAYQGLLSTNGLDLAESNNALALGENSNAANVTINAQNNVTQQLGITTEGTIYNNLINANYNLQNTYLGDAFTLNSTELANQETNDQTVYGLIGAGAFNLGGEGGSNTVAALNATNGYPTINLSSTSNNTQSSLGQQLGFAFTGLGNLLGGASLLTP